jgi:hypothetical protein
MGRFWRRWILVCFVVKEKSWTNFLE